MPCLRRIMKFRSIRTTLAFVGCMLLGNSLAFAQATRTWVSGVGDDVNPCSRTAPCKTFAGAISKTAAHGEISVLDPGGYGGVTITKGITISGVGTHASILTTGGTTAIIINIPNPQPGDIVTLHNLEINCAAGNTNGGGNIGVRLLSGSALVMEDVRIWGCVTGVQTEMGKTTINRGEFTNNTGVAIRSRGASTLTVENSEINANNVAVQAEGTS